MTPAEALQTALAAEHAAVHVLAALAGASRGTRGTGTDGLAEEIAERHDRHRGRREHLVVLLRTADLEPSPALPAYALPAHATTQDLRRGVLRVEETILATYAALVAASTEETRRWAVDALVESAAAALTWGGSPSPFPGATDLLGP